MNAIDLSQDIYSHDEVMRMLKRDREVRYEYVVRNQYNQTIGSLSNATGSISFDSTREIMRTCSITAKRSELLQISSIDYRVVPYFCILAPNKHWLRYPLGVFLVNPSAALNNKSVFVTVDGYDLAQIAHDAKLEDAVFYAEGAVYTSSISNRIGAIYSNYDVTADANLTNPADAEYEIGTEELAVINNMLDAINYYPLYFDENGVAHAEPYVFPEERTIELEYSADNKSVIFDGVTQASNLFEIPNRFIRYTDDPDHDPLRSAVTVTDPAIPSSTVNRGRIITDIRTVNDVATQTTLDNLTRRAAITASQHTETLEFSTVNMPTHGFKTCLQFRCPDIGIDAKYIESAWNMDLVPGGRMTHKCDRAVTI